MTQQMNLQRGLIGHWTMHDTDTNGDTLYDSSGYDTHGDVNGSPSSSTDSKVNGSYSFNGSDESIDIGPVGISGDEARTISCWERIDSQSSDWPGIFGFVEEPDGSGGDDGQQFHMGVRDDTGDIELHIYSDGITSDLSIDDTWHHLVGMFDGSTMDFYIDGEAYETDYDPSKTIDTYDYVMIAERNGDFVGGKIDDCRIYNRVLSESEVNQLYQMREQRHHNI